jgi:AAA domain
MTTAAEYEAVANRDIDAPSPNYVSILYGDLGSRKTTTACSMVGERGLLISSDESWKVLLNSRHKELYSKMKIIPYDGLSQLEFIKFEGYDTIIWDTFSQSVNEFLDLIYDKGKWPGNLRNKIISTHKDLKDVETLGFVDYRVTRDKFRPVLNKLFKETDAHIIFTSHMTEPMPSATGKAQLRRPSIPDATFQIIGIRADIIGNTRSNGNKFVIDVAQTLTQLGKSRIESIQGVNDLDSFVQKYKGVAFN